MVSMEELQMVKRELEELIVVMVFLLNDSFMASINSRGAGGVCQLIIYMMCVVFVVVLVASYFI